MANMYRSFLICSIIQFVFFWIYSCDGDSGGDKLWGRGSHKVDNEWLSRLWQIDCDECNLLYTWTLWQVLQEYSCNKHRSTCMNVVVLTVMSYFFRSTQAVCVYQLWSANSSWWVLLIVVLSEEIQSCLKKFATLLSIDDQCLYLSIDDKCLYQSIDDKCLYLCCLQWSWVDTLSHSGIHLVTLMSR